MKILGEANRQMLHAFNLEIIHPVTQDTMIFSAPIPRDMAELIEKLENNPEQ
jgi:23S rRNA pseudouridine1911/1915/1917 synthase